LNLETQELGNSVTARRGFTLIEMLVVMGIIAILIGVSLTSFSKMAKSADKTKAQELVSQAATALAAIYEKDGMWPTSICTANKDEVNGRLDEKIALILARRGYMSLSCKTDTHGNPTGPLQGRDRFGILTPWAAKVVEQKGASATKTTKVSGDKTIEDNILCFAVDLNGDGEITAEECGDRTGAEVIRATVAVWCVSKDGKGKVQSWTKGQEQKVQ